ncbi:MAG: tyrosine-type recombinase/integrase [Streptosporangiaceae bacterium]
MIERRGDSWRARYRGPDGRERSKSFKRKSDAERWLVYQRSLMAQGDWTDPARGRITFGEYAEAWLESRADLKPKTRHQYQSLMRQHIMPAWRNVPLGKITFEGLTHWVARLSLTGLGPSGIRQSAFVVSAALDHAVRSGRIRSNPARGLGLPRPKPRDYVYLTHAQVLALASEAGRWRLLVLLLAYTGLRWGEATALRVCDIDFDRRRVDVRRAFSDVGGRVVLGTPKSHQSRTVPLPRFLATDLAAAVDGKRPDELVFTMPGGTVMRLSNWRRATFVPARARARLSNRFRIHDLRHSAASLMIQAGYPPKMLQEILGHASITTTLDLYGHLYPGEMDRYADRLGDAATASDAAKMRPDDTGSGDDQEGPAR